MKKIFSHFLDRLFAVAGALFFLQIPLFITLYQQQLKGRVEELSWQVKHMEKTAAETGKNLASYIAKFKDHDDRDIASQGILMDKVYRRWKRLTKAFEALESSTGLTRPWVFVRFFQKEVATSTWHSFRPGLPLTWEACIYALIGMTLGWLCIAPFVKRDRWA